MNVHINSDLIPEAILIYTRCLNEFKGEGGKWAGKLASRNRVNLVMEFTGPIALESY